MENIVITENGKPFKWFDIPLKFGLIVALLKIILSTIQYQFFLTSWTMMMIIGAVSFIGGLVLFCVGGIQQRKLLGGYMNIKEAFQVVFVAMLISVVLNFVYDLIYMKYIDPDMMNTIRDSSMAFAEKWGAPQEKLDEMAETFEKQQADTFTFKVMLMSLLKTIIMYGIFGFICAAIIKKNKPSNNPA